MTPDPAKALLLTMLAKLSLKLQQGSSRIQRFAGPDMCPSTREDVPGNSGARLSEVHNLHGALVQSL